MADDVMQRVREGSGPDRELDGHIHRVVAAAEIEAKYDEMRAWLSEHYGKATPEELDSAARESANDTSLCPAYTASVDPWLALARERGLTMTVHHSRNGWTMVHLSRDLSEPMRAGRHAEAPRAAGLAMLEALGHE